MRSNNDGWQPCNRPCDVSNDVADVIRVHPFEAAPAELLREPCTPDGLGKGWRRYRRDGALLIYNRGIRSADLFIGPGDGFV
jgi:hypothetical protein